MLQTTPALLALAGQLRSEILFLACCAAALWFSLAGAELASTWLDPEILEGFEEDEEGFGALAPRSSLATTGFRANGTTFPLSASMAAFACS